MVKLLCLGSFLVGLMATAISYTIDYFKIENQVETEKTEMLKKD